MYDVRLLTHEELARFNWNENARKAIIIEQGKIKMIDLPEHGVAGIRMIDGRCDRIEYSFTKK